jgi:hypothetical protein
MLSGKPPFQGEAFGDLLLRHMTEAPAPLSAINPDVPDFLEEVVMRALAKRREDRFSTMRELQKGLSGATDGRADKTPPPFDVRRPPGTLTPPILGHTPLMTPQLAPRRRSWLMGGGLALLVAATGVVVVRANRSTPAPSGVVHPATASLPRVEPLPSAAPPDAAPTATATTEVTPPRGSPRTPAPPSGKKRPNKGKIDVKQW